MEVRSLPPERRAQSSPPSARPARTRRTLLRGRLKSHEFYVLFLDRTIVILEAGYYPQTATDVVDKRHAIVKLGGLRLKVRGRHPVGLPEGVSVLPSACSRHASGMSPPPFPSSCPLFAAVLVAMDA